MAANLTKGVSMSTPKPVYSVSDLSISDEVIVVPDHAYGDLEHDACRVGSVISIGTEMAMVEFDDDAHPRMDTVHATNLRRI